MGEQREDCSRLLGQITRYCSVIDKRSVVYICVFLFALSSGAFMEWLLAAAQKVVTIFLSPVSEPSWQSVAVAVVVLSVLSARKTAQHFPGERALTFFSFILAFAHAGCLLLLGESPPAAPQTWPSSTSFLVSTTSTDAQMVVAGSVFADADAHAWGRLHHVLF